MDTMSGVVSCRYQFFSYLSMVQYFSVHTTAGLLVYPANNPLQKISPTKHPQTPTKYTKQNTKPVNFIGVLRILNPHLCSCGIGRLAALPLRWPIKLGPRQVIVNYCFLSGVLDT